MSYDLLGFSVGYEEVYSPGAHLKGLQVLRYEICQQREAHHD
jgi:hypothetical protein